MSQLETKSPYVLFLVKLIGIAIAMCVVLAMMGRVWWCKVGDWLPWSWDIWSTHCSQHLIDPYALSHIEHGIGLFVILMLAREKLSMSSRLFIIALLEALWEIAENTPFMINRYRESTAALDYFGDSIINSLSDLTMCMSGAVLVHKTSLKIGVAAFFALELIGVLWIRDSLLLNMLMLTWPIEAIKTWQAGA